MARKKKVADTVDMAVGIGHNSTTMTVASGHLKNLVARIEVLNEEKQALADDIKEVYTEAKSNGFDVATLRKVIRLRAMDAAKRRTQQDMLDTYMHALGMLADTPLGQSALDREEMNIEDSARARELAELEPD